MKIALFTEGLYPDKIGGIQKHTFLLAKYLNLNGVKVDVYTYSKNSKKLKNEFKNQHWENVILITIDYKKSPFYFPGHFIYESWKNSVELFEAFKENDRDYDLIYIQGFSGMELLKKETSIPTILNFHGLEMYQKAANIKSSFQHAMFRPFVKGLLRKADYCVSLGGKLTTILNNLLNTSDKILVTPNGVEADWVSDKPLRTIGSIRKFVFIGRYERRKGVEELSALFQEIDTDLPFEFEFVGPIPKHKQLGHPKIKYHGLVNDQEKIKSILQEADVLVCPSWSEGMPTVILEAMASGCAVIASDVGAVSEMVSTQNGWLIEGGNIADLKNAFLEAISIPKKELQQKKERSIEIVKENFVWDKVVNLFLEQAKLVHSK